MPFLLRIVKYDLFVRMKRNVVVQQYYRKEKVAKRLRVTSGIAGRNVCFVLRRYQHSTIPFHFHFNVNYTLHLILAV